MTETDLTTAPVALATPVEAPAAPAADPAAVDRPASKAKTGLSGMVLPELRSLAGGPGIKGASGMRKGDLLSALQERPNPALLPI